MAHTLGGVTIHPDDEGIAEDVESFYSFQKVLDDTTETIGYYGAGSTRVDLVFVMRESANSGTGLSTLQAAARANSNVAWVSDRGAEGNVRILRLRAVRRQALNESDEVYDCTAQLVRV